MRDANFRIFVKTFVIALLANQRYPKILLAFVSREQQAKARIGLPFTEGLFCSSGPHRCGSTSSAA